MAALRIAWRELHAKKTSKLLWQATRQVSSLKHKGIEVTLTQSPQPKPDSSKLIFGKTFADHMLTVDWTLDDGWDVPKIGPFENFSLSPGLSALHYGVECFEGMKAYHCVDGKIRLFRPMENMKRLNKSAEVASLPNFDGEAFLECIKDLVRVDRDWVPKEKDCSLYIRPTLIGTDPFLGVARSKKARLYCITCPVGPYFATGTFNPVSLYASSEFVRAWVGGSGESKMGGNYGPTIRVQQYAESKGCNQVLWLYGDDQQITEVGTMNIFVHWINEEGEPEIATPPLTGIILPGVTRSSLLELGKTWGTHKVVERIITMRDVKIAVQEGRMKEIFGAGTACVVCPVSRIQFVDENIPIPTMETGAEVAKRFYKELTDIQFGRTERKDWSVLVD